MSDPFPDQGASLSIEACERAMGGAALAPTAFQRRVLRELCDGDGVTLVVAKPFSARLSVGDARYDVRLDGAYMRYKHGEVDVPTVVQEVRAALGLPSDGVRRQGPFPRLARPETVPVGAHSSPCPFDEDLAVFYVHVVGGRHVAIQAEAVGSEWRRPEVLLQSANANLGARTAAVPAVGHGEGPELVITYRSGDGLDASALLLPELREAMRGWVTGTACVAVPERDTLLVFGDSQPAFVSRMRERVAELHAHAEPGTRISASLYALGDGGEVKVL